MNKLAVFNLIKEKLEQQFEATKEEALNNKKAATHEESKAENKYDTRGLEASYMAQAQAKRLEQLKEELYLLSKVNLNPSSKVQFGSLVHLSDVEGSSGDSRYYFLLPVAGIKVKCGSEEILSVSFSSPLGQKLMAKEEGEELLIKNQSYEIMKIF